MSRLVCCWIVRAGVLLATAPMLSQAVPPEKANDARIDKLLSQMMLEEKVNLIRGAPETDGTYQGQAGYLPGVPRLHVPSLRMADGPPGVLSRQAGQAQTATMGVAATWSREDARANGEEIAREARDNGIDVILQPFINIDRDITFARAYNTFGEDPFLSGVMGAEEIRGAQAQNIMAMAKHYVGYDSNSYNIFIDPQTLHEVYVSPFEAAVEAGVSSVMCSYNRINGPFACGNADTLKTILKGEIGFKGFVTSDWGGVHSVKFLNEGLDMEMPGIPADNSPFAGLMTTYFYTAPPPPKPPVGKKGIEGLLGGVIPEEATMKKPKDPLTEFPKDAEPGTLGEALKAGTITEATVTAAARRVLYEMDRFGYLDGKQKHTVTPHDLERNAAVIRKTAEDAAVLLKNDGNILPLSSESLSSVAMIGPTAGQVDAIGTFGERSPGVFARQVSPVAAMQKMAPQAKITLSVADDMTGTPVPASAITHNGQPGLMRTGASAPDAQLNFTSAGGNALPPNTTATWTGDLTVAADGDYWLYLQDLGGRAVLKVDGKEVASTGAAIGAVHGDIQYPTQDNVVPTTDGLDDVRRTVELTKGAHSIEVQLTPDTSDAPAQIRLNWMTPEARQQAHDQAINAAKAAKVAVVFAWSRDKPTFHLPGDQDQLIAEIAAANSNTVVVLNTSQPVAMPWLSNVKAVLEAWWPGDEGGWSTADLLLGKANPGGRLPMTWAKRLEDYAANDPAHPERSDKGVDGKTTYSEGVLVGYRWFDAQKIEPLFPFGFGMSYTTFDYSGAKIAEHADGSATVSVHVKNTGNSAGNAVPEVYLSAPSNAPPGAQFAPKTLAGFTSVPLAAGAEKTVDIEIPSRRYDYWSTKDDRWIAARDREVMVGDSSRNLQPVR